MKINFKVTLVIVAFCIFMIIKICTDEIAEGIRFKAYNKGIGDCNAAWVYSLYGEKK